MYPDDDHTRDRTNVRQRARTDGHNCASYVRGKHAYARARARSRARTLPCHGALRSVVRPTKGGKGRETFEYKWPSFAIAHPNQRAPEGESVFK